jgi:alkanesulfonate monooxygenase SsuD/methylene tetrahydromethanopterin reductase-like flavin-dependent oxidoreductase (luciferase family)
MLGNDPGVIYVDNGNFRKRVQADGYETYFHDEFAGDFGHLTRRGNELLAENVARTIVEQFFGVDYRQGLMPSVPTGKTDLYAPEVRGVAPLAVSVSTATRRRRRTAGLRSALSEDAVGEQLRKLAEIGATDFLVAPYPVGEDAEESVARTRALLLRGRTSRATSVKGRAITDR